MPHTPGATAWGGCARVVEGLGLMDALPFLRRLSNSTLESISREAGMGLSGAQLRRVALEEALQVTGPARLAAAVAANTLDGAIGQHLSTMVPGITRLSRPRIEPQDVSTRLLHLLRRHGIDDWRSLGSWSLGDIFRLRNAGVTTVRELFVLVVRHGLLMSLMSLISSAKARGAVIDWLP